MLDADFNKRCTTCHEWKSEEYFNKSKTRIDRLSSNCKTCAVNVTNKSERRGVLIGSNYLSAEQMQRITANL